MYTHQVLLFFFNIHTLPEEGKHVIHIWRDMLYTHINTHTYMHTHMSYVLYFIYTFSMKGENKAHTCRNMCFMFVTRLYFSSSGIHQTPPLQKKHVKTPHCPLSDMYPFYPCSMTTVLWLNPRKNAKNAWPDMCFPSTNRAPLWPAALGDAFSTWCIFVGGRGESLLGCWFSLARGEGPTNWVMPTLRPGINWKDKWSAPPQNRHQSQDPHRG